MFWMAPLIGAGLGAVAGKKPLQGALLGAGLGAAGGALVPGLLGSLGGTAAATGAATTAATGATTAATGAATAPTGLLGTVGQYAKPFGEAAGAANSVRSLVSSQPQPIQSSPVAVGQGGAQGLATLVGQNQQETANQMSLEEQRRARAQGLINRIGGFNGSGFA